MFSVIIPTYNRGEKLLATVRSVLNQTYRDFEVIVVDDGGNDNTSELLGKLDDKRLRYFYKKNEERSIARNFGAEKAQGRYLNFMDSDDLMLEDHLAGIVRYLEQTNYAAKMIFTGYRVVDEKGRELSSYATSGLFPPARLLYGNYLTCIAVAIDRPLFMEEKFDTNRDIVVLEDWELWLRMASRCEIHSIPAKSILIINHTGRSVLNSPAAEMILRVNTFRKIAFANAPMVRRSTRAQRTLSMGLYSYAALHLALAREKRTLTLTYLLKALLNDPALVLKKRFYAIIKHLF